MASEGLFDRLQTELEGREKAEGLSMADVLALPDPLRRFVNWLLREEEEVGLADAARQLGQDEVTAHAALAGLVAKGFIRELRVHGETRYQVRLSVSRRRQVPLDLWHALDDRVEEPGR
jgi:hypothetical protein